MKLDQVWDMLIEVRFNLRTLWKWRERAARLPIAPYVKMLPLFQAKADIQIWQQKAGGSFSDECSGLSSSAARNRFPASFLNSSRSFRTIWEAAYQQRKWSIWCGVLLRPRSWTCARGQTSTRWERPPVYDSASYFSGEGLVFVLPGSVPSSVSR